MRKLQIRLSLALAVACGPASAALLSVEGEARDPANGRLLYREDHLIRGTLAAPTERIVLYRCPSGAAFARKQVDYAPSSSAPDFSLVDARDGYAEGLKRDGTAARVWSGGKRSALPSKKGVLVADAGFDQFLREHWDAVVGKGSSPINFVVPSFGKTVGFNVDALGTDRIGDEPVQNFRLKLQGVLGLLAPEIDVAYDAKDRTLRRFTGVSNIRDDNGKPLRTRIDFTKAPIDTDAAQWQAALSTPLKRCALGS